jgi:predicted ester cyclase
VTGDKVAVQSTMPGTHKGKLGNNEPTNKRGRITFIEIYHIVDGKITEVSHPSGWGMYWNAMVSGALFKKQEES